MENNSCQWGGNGLSTGRAKGKKLRAKVKVRMKEKNKKYVEGFLVGQSRFMNSYF